MLDNKKLIKISLIGFLICFTLIYIIEQNKELKITPISNISQNHLNNFIKTEGKLTKITQNSNHTFITIENNNNNNTSIKGIIFNSQNLSLNKTNYSLTGIIKSYKGELEIIIHEIHAK